MTAITLDHGNRVTVSVEPQQVVVEFVVGSSTWINMAVTEKGAREFAEALTKAADACGKAKVK